MPIYELSKTSIREIEKTTFAQHGILEREHLQKLLREKIDVISKDTMVIAEEFGDWEDSRRRIDLLCLDKDANLVVVELKRTEDGGHMDLQAIRYGAMISTMTFDEVVSAHQVYLTSLSTAKQDTEQIVEDSVQEQSARDKIVDFLNPGDSGEGDDIDQEKFAQKVKIILASAEFSKELMASAIWLRDSGVDISLVKMEPCYDGNRILLDVQQVIPLPETADYQFRVRQKKQLAQEAKRLSKDYSKYTLTIDDITHEDLNKRRFMYTLIRAILDKGIKPEDVAALMSWRRSNLFVRFEGRLDEEQFIELVDQNYTGTKLTRSQRYFCKADELFQLDGSTYALSNQWGARTEETATKILTRWPELNIHYDKQA